MSKAIPRPAALTWARTPDDRWARWGLAAAGLIAIGLPLGHVRAEDLRLVPMTPPRITDRLPPGMRLKPAPAPAASPARASDPAPSPSSAPAQARGIKNAQGEAVAVQARPAAASAATAALPLPSPTWTPATAAALRPGHGPGTHREPAPRPSAAAPEASASPAVAVAVAVPAVRPVQATPLLRAAPANPGRFAQTGCPFIRPPGLRRADLSRIVADKLAMATQRPANEIQASDTFADLLAPEARADARQRYRFAALAIGEALGFDAPARFDEAARHRGAVGAERALTVRHLNAIALNAYQEGADALPPDAEPNAVYRLDGVQVHAPAAAPAPPNWKLMHCGHDHVSFWRSGAGDSGAAQATVRITALPPWRGMDDFRSHLRTVLAETAPPGYRVADIQVDPLGDACADARMTAIGDAGPHRLRARVCHAGAAARHGPTVMFSRSGEGDLDEFQRAAHAFIAANLPR